MDKKPQSTAVADALPAWAELVLQKARSLRFGSIEIVLHEGRVIQVESTEKIRLRPGGEPAERA